jgi:hypothetical protein
MPKSANSLRFFVCALAIGLPLAALGLPWDVDMVDSQAVKAYEQKMASPVEGTVIQPTPANQMSFRHQYDRESVEGQALTSPFPSSDESIELGREMYGLYCTPCHGEKQAMGPVAGYGAFMAAMSMSGPFEDFETGNLDTFEYQQNDTKHWSMVDDNDQCHSGDHCLRSPSGLPAKKTNSVSMDYRVLEDGEISFWTKTEVGGGALRFYIDDSLTRTMSQTAAWVEVTVPVTKREGTDLNRTFRWEFTQTAQASAGHGWIDDIDLPGHSYISEKTDGYVYLTITNGGQIMPSYGWAMNDQEAWSVVHYLRTLPDATYISPISMGDNVEENNE